MISRNNLMFLLFHANNRLIKTILKISSLVLNLISLLFKPLKNLYKMFLKTIHNNNKS